MQPEEQEAVQAEQEKRTDVDVWVDLIVPMLSGKRNIAQTEIFTTLGIPAKDTDWRHASRIGRIMKKLGWIGKRERRENEDRVIYYHPEHVGKRDEFEW